MTGVLVDEIRHASRYPRGWYWKPFSGKDLEARIRLEIGEDQRREPIGPFPTREAALEAALEACRVEVREAERGAPADPFEGLG